MARRSLRRATATTASKLMADKKITTFAAPNVADMMIGMVGSFASGGRLRSGTLCEHVSARACLHVDGREVHSAGRSAPAQSEGAPRADAVLPH